ncbi:MULTISPECIES: sugar-binding transcriptional regulator [Staphylococcus cohnii species complex]|uniref:Transcriptional regulator n=1 Tax=Staphylococcus ureilyticus TaxID=94138 RepID=A0AB34ALF5_STAUR|nr:MULTISPECIES: sugar-binding domain-containing protein [Staphylococcus]MBD6918576.1 sugar-binding transcriptional regulator [Staphylococcus aureus]MBD6921221.1 sugar-binding transcriptional regulator [Staphylococcus aureus]PNZ43907.1 transcriptional regulator [Staphylococcus ureilyticus]QKU19759.1 sugar-binding transcriptional regulator [Staphylococcus cohnii]WQJ59521.1 sugar-binding domain-containing protein [Staphylococcus cohnii]
MSILDDTRVMIKICKLYYQQELNQNKIAEIMGVSRPTVSKYLTLAKQKGIVEIKINENDLLELESQLEEKYGLEEVICVKETKHLKTKLGIAGSNYLVRKLCEDDIVAVSAGTTMDQVVKNTASNNKFPSVLFVPLVGGMGNASMDIHANHIADSFSKCVGAHNMLLHAPVVVDDIESKHFMMNQKFVSKITEKMKQATIAVVGIGANPEQSTMVASYRDELSFKDIKNKAIGDIMYNFIDENGKKIDCEWNNRIISLEIEEYKRIPLKIGIAGGKNKEKAIKAALNNHLIDVLVTDENTGMELLEKRN